jgi:hypothetical protein
VALEGVADSYGPVAGKSSGRISTWCKKGVDAFLSQKDGRIEMHSSYLRVISPTKMLQRLSRKAL